MQNLMGDRDRTAIRLHNVHRRAGTLLLQDHTSFVGGDFVHVGNQTWSGMA